MEFVRVGRVSLSWGFQAFPRIAYDLLGHTFFPRDGGIKRREGKNAWRGTFSEKSRFVAKRETSHDMSSLKKARNSVYWSRLLGNDLFHQGRNSMMRQRYSWCRFI